MEEQTQKPKRGAPKYIPNGKQYGAPDASGKSLEEIRELYLAEAYALLREPRVWACLRKLLRQQKLHARLQAFQMILGTLVPNTKPGQDGVSRGPVSVNVVNAISRPKKPEVVVEVTKQVEGNGHDA